MTTSSPGTNISDISNWGKKPTTDHWPTSADINMRKLGSLCLRVHVDVQAVILRQFASDSIPSAKRMTQLPTHFAIDES